MILFFFCMGAGMYPQGKPGIPPPPPPEKYKSLEGVQIDQVLPAGKQFFYMVIPSASLKKILGTSRNG